MYISIFILVLISYEINGWNFRPKLENIIPECKNEIDQKQISTEDMPKHYIYYDRIVHSADPGKRLLHCLMMKYNVIEERSFNQMRMIRILQALYHITAEEVEIPLKTCLLNWDKKDLNCDHIIAYCLAKKMDDIHN